MNMQTLFIAMFFFLISSLSGIPSTTDNETHSTKVEGTLLCGTAPLKNAVVRLFRGESEDVGDSIGEVTTDQSGKFLIQGDTARFPTNKANLDPHLKIYHKCNDADGASGYRRVQLRYPRSFTSLGAYPRVVYNIGRFNLELIFPGETRQKTIEGYTGPKI